MQSVHRSHHPTQQGVKILLDAAGWGLSKVETTRSTQHLPRSTPMQTAAGRGRYRSILTNRSAPSLTSHVFSAPPRLVLPFCCKCSKIHLRPLRARVTIRLGISQRPTKRASTHATFATGRLPRGGMFLPEAGPCRGLTNESCGSCGIKRRILAGQWSSSHQIRGPKCP